MNAAGETAWQEFRHRREEALAARHGVLAQVALHWIEPAKVERSVEGLPGQYRLEGGRLGVSGGTEELEVLDGSREDLRLARFGDDVQVEVIHRGGRTGLRLMNPAAPRRTGFTGVPTYPYDPAAVLEGTWRREPTTVTVGSALAWLEQELPSPGIATLETPSGPVEMTLTGDSSLLFTDGTSETDSADWRQVTAELDGSRIRVDLNRALNFPSAFSLWGTCPRPPAGNHLPFAVRAGERRVEPTER
ncbi:DUF1684 domain-containing protein [Brachybacterium sacelli]|uniref:Uncharacterized protein (DUF1684 family) n=1 Tax=Brachybacterium sacelli TaxID=173364 RepID=A0ABS4WZZ8_9MICO|nr:DUF1684 domain-containing protein [Brachybacterium sacelli]MBP2381777.1 uncharacterized protein (DUF1684 family) [Brachybacterium sacelli]